MGEPWAGDHRPWSLYLLPHRAGGAHSTLLAEAASLCIIQLASA